MILRVEKQCEVHIPLGDVSENDATFVRFQNLKKDAARKRKPKRHTIEKLLTGIMIIVKLIIVLDRLS